MKVWVSALLAFYLDKHTRMSWVLTWRKGWLEQHLHEHYRNIWSNFASKFNNISQKAILTVQVFCYVCSFRAGNKLSGWPSVIPLGAVFLTYLIQWERSDASSVTMQSEATDKLVSCPKHLHKRGSIRSQSDRQTQTNKQIENQNVERFPCPSSLPNLLSLLKAFLWLPDIAYEK